MSRRVRSFFFILRPKTRGAWRSHRWNALAVASLYAACLLPAQPESTLAAPASGVKDFIRLYSLLQNQQPLTWVFTGDSVTQGAKWTGDSRSYPEIFAERVRWELHRGRDVMTNTAISGNHAQDILDDFDWRVAHLHPDVVSLMIGMNDCVGGTRNEAAFAANLVELVRRSRALGAIPILHTTNTTLYDRDRVDLPQYNAIIVSVAAPEHVILVDNWNYWQQSRTPANLADWLGNPVHPNGLGHIQIARLLLQTLGLFDSTSAVRRFGVQADLPAAPPQACL